METKTMSMKERVITMMDSQMTNLESDLQDAKMEFANITLDEGDYRCRDERRTNCKVIEGQISMLKSMMNNVMAMDFEINMPALARA